MLAMRDERARPRPPATALPTPEAADRLVLLGGSFDPPHLAHTELGARARDAAAGPGAWLVFVPAARSPFKSGPPTPAADRAAMLQLAIAPLANACMWTDEIDRARPDEPSYWVDTLRRAKAARPDARLWFVLGTDQAAEFHRWREPREILSLAEPLVLARAPIVTREALAESLRQTGAWSETEVARWLDALLDVGVMPFSATQARDLLHDAGPDHPALRSILAPAVLDYIRAHRLYTDPPG